MKAIQTINRPRFAMINLKDMDSVGALICSRSLHLMDGSVLLMLLGHTCTYSGRIQVTTARLAEQLHVAESAIRASLARLKKEHILRLIRDRNTGERYYRLNPSIVQTSAKGGLQAMAEKEFAEA